MHQPPMNASFNRQRGVVLVVALVLLVAITLLSLAGISTTTLELRMATNQQARVNAFQQAEAGIDAVASNLDNFAVSGRVGETRCTPGFHDSRYEEDLSGEINCGAIDLNVPADYDLSDSRALVARLAPPLQAAPRFIETSHRLKVATFKIDSRFDARAERGSRAEHNQGMLIVRLPGETVISRDEYD